MTGPPPAPKPLWGAAVGGNSDPAPLEAELGGTLGVRRTYWNQGTTASALSTAAGDVQAGRVPWLSFKLNDSWISVAGGSADAWAEQLGEDLQALGGPVMVTFHHEPEGDGTIADFPLMHDRLYHYMAPHSNIMCGPVMTGWTVLNNPTYALDAIWPGEFRSGDFIAFDCYNYYGTYSKQGTFNATTGVWTPQPGDTININPNQYVLQSDYYRPLAAWAKTKGVKWAIGEFGFSAAAAQYDIDRYGKVTWLQEAWNSAVELGDCLALAYFSSAYHARTDWRIDGDPNRLSAYRDILQHALTGAPR